MYFRVWACSLENSDLCLSAPTNKQIPNKDKTAADGKTGDGDSPVLVSSAQVKELTSRMERKGRSAGYTATVHGATPALITQPDQVRGTRPQHEGVGIIAQRCKQARLSLEATHAVNCIRHDSSTPQRDTKVAGNWSSEQQPTQTDRTSRNIPQNLEGYGRLRSTRPASSPSLQWQSTPQQIRRVLSHQLSLTLTLTLTG